MNLEQIKRSNFRHYFNIIKKNPIALFKSDQTKAFLDVCYQQLLKREPDQVGLFFYTKNIQESKSPFSTKIKIINDIVTSQEYCSLNKIPCEGLDPLIIHHNHRIHIFSNYLPQAKNILDLGGTASYDIRGSLLAMGYPYTPNKITIIDYLPQERMDCAHSTLDETNHTTQDGIKIEFIYDSFTNLDSIDDESMDMIMMGQTIEHITKKEAHKLYKSIYRILKPGGHYCLDTPNRHITKLISPNGFIHPEHKIEYYPNDLIAHIKSEGFHLVESKGISPLPESIKNQIYTPKELVLEKPMSQDPNLGFSFFLHLQKDMIK